MLARSDLKANTREAPRDLALRPGPRGGRFVAVRVVLAEAQALQGIRRAASSSSRSPRDRDLRPSDAARRGRASSATRLGSGSRSRVGIGRRLQAGEYRFDRPMTVQEVVAKIARGDVYLVPITFREGLTIQRNGRSCSRRRAWDPRRSSSTARVRSDN